MEGEDHKEKEYQEEEEEEPDKEEEEEEPEELNNNYSPCRFCLKGSLRQAESLLSDKTLPYDQIIIIIIIT
jgi:hypothetical protein